MEWFWRICFPTCLARLELPLASSFVLQEVLLQLVVGVLKLGALFKALEGQGVVGVLAAEVGSRKRMSDVGTGFVVVKPD